MNDLVLLVVLMRFFVVCRLSFVILCRCLSMVGVQLGCVVMFVLIVVVFMLILNISEVFLVRCVWLQLRVVVKLLNFCLSVIGMVFCSWVCLILSMLWNLCDLLRNDRCSRLSFLSSECSVRDRLIFIVVGQMLFVDWLWLVWLIGERKVQLFFLWLVILSVMLVMILFVFMLVEVLVLFWMMLIVNCLWNLLLMMCCVVWLIRLVCFGFSMLILWFVLVFVCLIIVRFMMRLGYIEMGCFVIGKFVLVWVVWIFQYVLVGIFMFLSELVLVWVRVGVVEVMLYFCGLWWVRRVGDVFSLCWLLFGFVGEGFELCFWGEFCYVFQLFF